MSLVIKTLPVILLFLHISNANHRGKYFEPLIRSVKINLTDLEQKYEKECNNSINLNNINSYKDITVVSTNKPTFITFRRRVGNSTYKGDALITRISDSGNTTKRCNFPAITSEYTEIAMLAYSFENEIEILLITKWLDEQDPSTDLFVVNMTNCEYTRVVIPMEFSDFPRQNMGLVVLRPWDSSQFTIFSFNGWRVCGSFMCKRIFDVANNVLSRPVQFYWLNDEKDEDRVDIYSLASSADTRFVAIQIPKPTKARFVSLTERGSLINSMDFSTGNIKFMKSSASYSDQSICYISMYNTHLIHCQMVKVNKDFMLKLNVTINMNYKIEALATRNLPLGKIMLLMLGCGSVENCEKYEMQLTKIEPNGSSNLFKKFNTDKICVPKSEFYLTLYEEGENICVYYRCDLIDKSINLSVLINCFKFKE